MCVICSMLGAGFTYAGIDELIKGKVLRDQKDRLPIRCVCLSRASSTVKREGRSSGQKGADPLKIIDMTLYDSRRLSTCKEHVFYHCSRR